MDGAPIHDVLLTVHKQLNILKTVATQQQDSFNEMKQAVDEKMLGINSKLDEKLTGALDAQDLIKQIIPRLETNEKLLTELQSRPLIDPEQTIRLENVEKKLGSFYGTDTNILGRVGFLEEGRLHDQQSLAQAMTQIKLLSESMNQLKHEMRNIKKDSKSLPPMSHPPVAPAETAPGTGSGNGSEALDRQLKSLQDEWKRTVPTLIHKEEISRLKDLLNYIANDLQREVKGCQTIVQRQQEEIAQLKQNQPPPSPQQSSSATSTRPHTTDEILNRLLTLEIRMNHLATAAIPSNNSPPPSFSSSSSFATPFSESLKQQISENEKNIHEAMIKIDNLTGKVDEQRGSLEELRRAHDSKLKRHGESLSQVHATNTELMNQLQNLENKSLALEKKIQNELTRAAPLHASPPNTPLRPHNSYLPSPAVTMIGTESGPALFSSKNLEDSFKNKLKTLCEELQTSLQSLRQEMRGKHHDLELLVEKAFLPCEGCGGAITAGVTGIPSLGGGAEGQEPSTNQSPPPLDEAKGGQKYSGAMTATSTLSLLNHRLCRRRCHACLDREGLTSYTSKEMMERLNEVTEYLNKVNKKLKTQSDKIQLFANQQEKFSLSLEDTVNQIYHILPIDIEKLSEKKLEKEDAPSLIMSVISQYIHEAASDDRRTFYGLPSALELQNSFQNLKNDFILMHTTSSDALTEELNKLKRLHQLQTNLLAVKDEEFQFLSKSIQKIQESFVNYTTNAIPMSGGGGGGGGGGSSTVILSRQRSGGVGGLVDVSPPVSELEMKLQIQDLKERYEKMMLRLTEMESGSQHSEDGLKKLRSLLDSVREEMKKNFKEQNQHVQQMKNQIVTVKDIDQRIQHSISHLDPHLFHKDRIIELKEDVEKMKRYEKILEKRLLKQHDDLMDLLEEQKRVWIEEQKRNDNRVLGVMNSLQSHVENPTVHLTIGGYIPSFPSSPLYPSTNSGSPAPLSSSIGYSQGHSGGNYEDLIPSNSLGLINSKMKTYPELFRHSVNYGSQSPQDTSQLLGVTSSSPELLLHDEEKDRQKNELQEQIEFEDYVRNTLNPITERKQKKDIR
jgi:hypothetical protein